MAVTGSKGTPAGIEPTEQVGAITSPVTFAETFLGTPRRPYHKPQLRQLGSVRDLTFGSPIAGVNDFMGGRIMVM